MVFYPESFLDVVDGFTPHDDLFYRIGINEELNGVEEFVKDANPDLMGVFQFAIMVGRIPKRVKISTGAIVSIGATCKSPGHSVMWAYAITRLYDKLNRMITVSDLLTTFPHGFPNAAEQERLWDGQKGCAHNIKVDNILDTKEVWEPITGS